MGFTIKEVKTSEEIKEFIKFPHSLYKKSKEYVPVLDSDEYKIFTEDVGGSRWQR